MIAAADRIAAMCDPDYHRYLMFGALDARQERQRGRALEAHEKQGELRGPQLEIIRRAERAIADRAGDVIVYRTARQTAKNECEAMLESRALGIWSGIPGSIWIRTAPTHKPQIVNSKTRLEKHLRADPLVAGRWSKRDGYVYEVGSARVEFLSAAASANVVGATASIALSVDEAHKVDRGKFEEDFGPFTASTNAPTLLWGVAAAKQDLLYEYRGRAEGTDRLLEFPAAIWCELIPAYARHYESRRNALGADHPVILTQYDLVDVEAIGTYLNDRQRAALFSGDHPRLEQPRKGMRYSIVVDLGGESELALADDEIRDAEPGRDSTNAWIVETADDDAGEPYARARIVNGIWWTGREHMGVLPDLLKLIEHWQIESGVVDARGVGEAVALAVNRRYPAVQAYKASTETVSLDCYDLLARINTGSVQFWREDPAHDAELREAQAQARHTRYQIHGHELMKLAKPVGSGSSSLHIDGIKALTYLRLALQPAGGFYRWASKQLADHRQGTA